MALARKDIRAKLDADYHARLVAICEVDKIDMGVWIEAVLLPMIDKRVHDAIQLARQLPRPGISGKDRRRPGISGSGRE